jgi:hypothetical protein
MLRLALKLLQLEVHAKSNKCMVNYPMLSFHGMNFLLSNKGLVDG